MTEEKRKKPIYRNWWFWLAAVLLIVLIGSAVGIGILSANPTSNAFKTYYIGDTVTSSDAQFKVLRVDNKKMISDGSTEISTNLNFAIITLEIKNIGNEELNFSLSSFKLKQKGEKYSVHPSSVYLQNGFYVTKDIHSGATEVIRFAYEIPAATLETEYVLIAQANRALNSVKIMLTDKR